MKIKKYYELITEEVRKLYVKIKQESMDNLPYIIDDGYKVECTDGMRWIKVYIKNINANEINSTMFGVIKDDVIPYLKMMDSKYYIELITIHGIRSEMYTRELTKNLSILELENMDFFFNHIEISFKKTWKK